MIHSPGISQLQPISAQMSSTNSDRVGADKCIDGITDGTSAVCHSFVEPAPWLALDFGDGTSVAVEKVVLYNRGDSKAARTRQVEVRDADIFSNYVQWRSFAGDFSRTCRLWATS